MGTCVYFVSSSEILSTKTAVEADKHEEWREDLIPIQFDSSGWSIDDVKGVNFLLTWFAKVAKQTLTVLQREECRVSALGGTQPRKAHECLE